MVYGTLEKLYAEEVYAHMDAPQAALIDDILLLQSLFASRIAASRSRKLRWMSSQINVGSGDTRTPHVDVGYLACGTNIDGEGTRFLGRALRPWKEGLHVPEISTPPLPRLHTTCFELDHSAWGSAQYGVVHVASENDEGKANLFSFYLAEDAASDCSAELRAGALP